MIDFPASPNVGQQFTAAGVNWTWDGFKWTATGLNTPYLPLSGGTLTGPLTLASNPVNALDAVTKQYADQFAGANRIINGDMRIDQRNNGASGTAVGYTVDRWQYVGTQTTKGTWLRQTNGAIMLGNGFGYQLSFTSSSAYSPLVADDFNFSQPIEADMIVDFAWGTPQAQPVTLSFWVQSSLSGTFGGALRNGPNPSTRSYPFSFSIPVANTWTKVVITIPGDTAGAWVLQGNAIGATLTFDLGSGANFRGPANAWASANYHSVNGAQSIVGTNVAFLFITGVKLEIGNVATPFNRQSLAKSMADCQRYYQQYVDVLIGGYAAANGATFYSQFIFPVAMRAAPTITPTPSYVNSSALVINTINTLEARLNLPATAVGASYCTGPWTASAEL